jgi:hypothetical protein
MDWHSLFESVLGIHSHEIRTWIILVNALITLANFSVIVAIIVSVRRFRKRVSLQDQSRIAYLEEFKGHIVKMFEKLDNMQQQLNRIEDRQRGRKCGSD